eukprot:g20813.t1
MFAKWVVCNTRRLRISNVPTYGSAGIYRQAGPLSAHTAAQMEKVGEEIVNDVEELEQQGHQRGRRCGFSAQALEKVEKDKDKLKKTSRRAEEQFRLGEGRGGFAREAMTDPDLLDEEGMDFNVDDAKALSTEIGTDAPDEFYEPRDTNGLLTIPMLSKVWQHLPVSRLIFGLDANTHEKRVDGKAHVLDFEESYRSLGLKACWGDVSPKLYTTFNARTYLQPQLNKASKSTELEEKGDRNPKEPGGNANRRSSSSPETPRALQHSGGVEDSRLRGV